MFMVQCSFKYDQKSSISNSYKGYRNRILRRKKNTHKKISVSKYAKLKMSVYIGYRSDAQNNFHFISLL